MTKNIISTMIKQHRKLQDELKLIMKMIKNKKNVNFTEIFGQLNEFKADLLVHLDLENTYFYPELIKNMKKKGQDTKKTEKFIDEMLKIEEDVFSFLKKFNEAKKIEARQEIFTEEFSKIIEILTWRIESEESGIYAYWNIF